MNCDGVRELLSAYVDGELSSGELLRVEQHLRRCPLCAEEVDALRQAIAYVGTLEEVELPAGFREGLRARLAQVAPQLQPADLVVPLRPAWQRRARRWALPAAAAAAFALATSGVYGQLGSLVNRVAESRPPAAVNVPQVDPDASAQPAPTLPQVAVNPTDTNTKPAPVTETTPPVATVTTPPQVKVDQEEPAPPNPETTIGETSAGPMQIASLVDQVPALATLPAQIANRTTVQAILPDPTSACNGLKSAVPGAECSVKGASGHVEVRFRAPLTQAAAVAAQVNDLIGEGATFRNEELDRASQLQTAFERLATIDEDLQKLAQAAATAKDPDQKLVEETALARRQEDGEKAKAEYNQLYTEVNTRLFVIDLQKQGQ